jgi:hypothetical protein
MLMFEWQAITQLSYLLGRRQRAYCSFCRRSYRDVGPLVEGPGHIYICGECVSLCQKILDDATATPTGTESTTAG